MNDPTPPLLSRIVVVTTAAPDLDGIIATYAATLDYRVRSESCVGVDRARSWGAPEIAGRRCAVLSSDAAPERFVRFVECDEAPRAAPLTRYGWSAWEIIVDDPYRLHDERLLPSRFRVIGAPEPLRSLPTIHATQVVGPANEVLYLTAERGNRAASILPEPGASVGWPFIVVVAGPDIAALHDWYAAAFRLQPRPISQRSAAILSTALGLHPTHLLPVTTCKLAEHGNLIQLDQYPADAPGIAAAPVKTADALPQGNAIASFGVRSLDEIGLDWITPPMRHAGIEYRGRRSATVRGIVGERIELIEDDGP